MNDYAGDYENKKPYWIRKKYPLIDDQLLNLSKIIEINQLHTVCEKAKCPNILHCFSKGTATFLIMGTICTRNCPFCAINHGKPKKLDINEPEQLSNLIVKMNLKYVIITSVDRDDIKEAGAKHFAKCIKLIRLKKPDIIIEILTPDFKGCLDNALEIIANNPPDVFNHNIETVPRLYKVIKPGANYINSLKIIKKSKDILPKIISKSGLILGLGETINEVKSVMQDLINTGVDLLTIGQYLCPSKEHLPVSRYLLPIEFKELEEYGITIGFKQVISAPMVRSSYNAYDAYKKLICRI